MMYYFGNGNGHGNGNGNGNGHNVKFFSTEGMMRHAKNSSADTFVVATETGILYRMRKENPSKRFIPISENAVCKYMKSIALEKVYRSLSDMVYEVRVPSETAAKARLAIERMLAIN
jgi:quinolinate synthase